MMNFPQFLSIVPAAVNHLLAKEDWARAKLVPHAGKTARFDAGFQRFDLTVEANGYFALAQAGAEPAVKIKVKAADLPMIAADMQKAFSYVRIEGDADFANSLSQVSQGLRWDAEDDLAKLFGDVAAVRMVSTAKAGIAAALDGHKRLAENLAEYLTEEKPVLMRPPAVSDFAAEVARLRDDVERMQKRIEKLENKRVEGSVR
ncbi:MAG: sterol-binding protein [Burkholderiaceae bacterium]|nr:sterol-binding protein [Burkholderiaceae bacterium]